MPIGLWIALWCRWGISSDILRGSWRTSPLCWGCSARGASLKKFLLSSLLLLLRLQHSSPCLNEGVFDLPGNLNGKNRPGVNRARHWTPPGFQHLIQFLSRIAIHSTVGVHESGIQPMTKEQRVGGSDILRDGVKNIKCRKLMVRPGFADMFYKRITYFTRRFRIFSSYDCIVVDCIFVVGSEEFQGRLEILCNLHLDRRCRCHLVYFKIKLLLPV